MRFKTRPNLVEAFELTPELSIYRLEILFKTLGFELLEVRTVFKKPFNENDKIFDFKLKYECGVTNMSCKQGEFICLENEILITRSKEEFEENFEPIEPILQELENEMFQS